MDMKGWYCSIFTLCQEIWGGSSATEKTKSGIENGDLENSVESVADSGVVCWAWTNPPLSNPPFLNSRVQLSFPCPM